MPNDTIDRSIKKAAGDANAANYESITYEGYGPSGTAIIVETLTDNRNRTASNVRNAFTKGSGNVGTNGCVSFMFDRKGQIIVDKEKASIGMLQRYLKVGFNRAARIMDQLEEAGIVGPEEGTKPRKVLMTSEELQAVKEDL